MNCFKKAVWETNKKQDKGLIGHGRTRMTECGRSLLEMLAVLAIISILTIGTISFYQSIVNGHKADALYNDIKTRLLLNRERSGKIFSTDMDNKSTYELPITIEKNVPVAGYNKVTVSDVKNEICSRLLTKQWPEGSRLYINNQVYGVSTNGCPANPCSFAVVGKSAIQKNLDLPQLCSNDNQCGDCERCNAGGECEEGCDVGMVCAKDFDNPAVAKQCRPEENVIDDTYCAHPDGHGNCCDSNGANCCPPDRPLMTADGVCRSCEDSTYNVVVKSGVNVSQNCTRCPNRELKTSWYTNEFCSVKTCPPETPWQNYQGKCLACDDPTTTSNITFVCDPDRPDRNYHDLCSLCPNRGEVGYVYGHGYECVICPGESYKGEDGRCTCPPEKPLLARDGCHACDENVKVSTFNQEAGHACSVCPNRKEFHDCCRGTTYCGLINCNSDQLHDRTGVCYDCSDSRDVLISDVYNNGVITGDVCSVCNGQRYTWQKSATYIYCKKCPDQGTPAWDNLSDDQKTECTPLAE